MGLILICRSEVADARMRMFNADGSESEMCGNGIRCVAKFVYDHKICQQPTLKIETGAGVLSVDVEVADGLVERVRVDMGRPILEPARIPVALPRGNDAEQVVDVPLSKYISLGGDGWQEECGLDDRMTGVSMGNPHVMIYCQNVAAVPLEMVGPIIERHSVFPKRINVHFVEVHSPTEVHDAHLGARQRHNAGLRHWGPAAPCAWQAR